MVDKPAASAPQTLLINPPTMPQAATDRQPIGDNKSLSDVRRLMKEDPDGQGVTVLGYDGVLRTFDAEHNILDAVGLNPAQIREYYEGLPLPERLRTADGRNVSRSDMFHPDTENFPKKFTEEEKARILAQNKEMAERGVITCILGKSADKGGSKA